jgi:hypothetical protein
MTLDASVLDSRDPTSCPRTSSQRHPSNITQSCLPIHMGDVIPIWDSRGMHDSTNNSTSSPSSVKITTTTMLFLVSN